MRYTNAAAFRQALEQRLKNEARKTGLTLDWRRQLDPQAHVWRPADWLGHSADHTA